MSKLVPASSRALVPVAPPGAAEIADPSREIRIGGAIIGLFVFGFVGWSAVAHLDSAVHAPGVVRVAGDRQTVQSASGGVVSAIRVHEGDRVKAGEVLLEFQTTEALAQERSLANRVLGLQAEIARIGTEQANGAHIAAPAEWSTLPADDRDAAKRALASEQANLDAQRLLLSSERAVLQQRIAQVGDQIAGYNERQTSNGKQDSLNQDELHGVQELYRQGYATKTRVLALQRSAASIQGDTGATTAEIARLRSSAGETRLQIMQLQDQRHQENADRLRTAQTELQTVLPQWRAARQQLELQRVRAPVAGTVLGLTIHTIGGVAAAGQKLMEVVPTDGALVVESQVSLADANDLRPGQKAKVRLGSLSGRNLAPMDGVVSRVSGDSLTDDKTGRSFYTATIQVPRRQLDEAAREADFGGTVKPGTPASVAVPLKSRTALQYWIGPLTERFEGALSEQ